MNYKNRIQERKIKNILLHILNIFRFKSLHLTFPKKMVIAGNLLWCISLFMTWIEHVETQEKFNSFQSLSGNIWYLLGIVFFVSSFTILSNKYKEKIKLYSDISFKTHFIVITSGIFILSFSIISLSFINGLQTYIWDIIYGKGIISAMTSGIIILTGGYYIRKDFYNKNSEIIFNQSNSSVEPIINKNNMKLPF